MYGSTKTIFDLERINIKDYMWNFRHGLSGREAYQATVRTTINAFRIKWPTNMSSIGLHNMTDISGEPFWKDQIVEYIPSNLGSNMGSVYYFRCSDCNRRVKYLYLYNPIHSPLCRRCCRLGYKQPNRKARRLSGLLNRPYLSREQRYHLANKFGITKDDISLENQ